MSAEDFRRELQLSIDLFEVQPEHIARVTQLINKSNQFNLTTRRKTENDIKNLIEDPRQAFLPGGSPTASANTVSSASPFCSTKPTRRTSTPC